MFAIYLLACLPPLVDVEPTSDPLDLPGTRYEIEEGALLGTMPGECLSLDFGEGLLSGEVRLYESPSHSWPVASWEWSGFDSSGEFYRIEGALFHATPDGLAWNLHDREGVSVARLSPCGF